VMLTEEGCYMGYIKVMTLRNVAGTELLPLLIVSSKKAHTITLLRLKSLRPGYKSPSLFPHASI